MNEILPENEIQGHALLGHGFAQFMGRTNNLATGGFLRRLYSQSGWHVILFGKKISRWQKSLDKSTHPDETTHGTSIFNNI